MRLIPVTAALVLTLAGCGADKPVTPAAPSKPVVFQVTGSITLRPGDFIWSASPPSCAGDGGYDDMKVGAQTVVSDAAGATLALGSIVEAKPEIGDSSTADGCTLRFLVLNVPSGQKFYGVEVSHRGRVQYTEVDARRDLTLTLS